MPLPDKPSIAVLPFANMSGDDEQEYFADGIAEDIITALSRFGWFYVIARNSSFTYKHRAVDVKQVARELGVQYVLEGSVRKAGARVRITAQLVDALTGRHIWAERYDRELTDVFAVQDEITAAITAAVAPSFVVAEAGRVERKAPQNLDAWDHAIRGNWHLWRMTQADFDVATRSFEAALALDATSVTALAGLSYLLDCAYIYGWAADPLATRARAHELAQRAVAIAPDDAAALAALACACCHLPDFDTAIRSAGAAIELNPNFAMAEGALALVNAHLGNYTECFMHAERAERLSPHDPSRALWLLARGFAAVVTGDYEEAVQWGRRLVAFSADLPTGWRLLASSYGNLGRLDEARAAVEHIRRLSPGITITTTRQRLPVAPETADNFEHYLDGLRKAGLPE